MGDDMEIKHKFKPTALPQEASFHMAENGNDDDSVPEDAKSFKALEESTAEDKDK